MLQYEQATGKLRDSESVIIGQGYSGHGEGRNNPEMQYVSMTGPIPQGIYNILPPRDSVSHGPFVMPLAPAAGTDTKGRAGFLIHGDSIQHPGEASEGCIILPRAIREKIWREGDHTLKVISGETVAPDLDGSIAVG